MAPRDISGEQLALIAQTLKKAREDKSESIADAAFKIALSPAQLRAIESGDLKPFYSTYYFYQAAARYADFLGVTLPEEKKTAPSPVQTEAENSVTSKADEKRAAKSKNQDTASIKTDIQLQAKPLEARASSNQSKTEKKKLSPLWMAAAAAASLALVSVVVIRQEALAPNTSESQAIAKAEVKEESAASTPASVSTPAPTPAPPATQTTQTTQTAPTPQSPMKSVSLSAGESHLQISAATWVQIVLTNGEKQNLRTEPGQKIVFEPEKTAAIVFGRPEQARLNVNGRTVDITPFILAESPARALVIVSKVR